MSTFGAENNTKGFTIGDSTTTSSPDPYLQNNSRIILEQGWNAIDSMPYVGKRAPVGFTPDQLAYHNRIRSWFDNGNPDVNRWTDMASEGIKSAYQYKAPTLGTYTISDEEFKNLTSGMSGFQYMTPEQIAAYASYKAQNADPVADIIAANINRGSIRDVTTGKTYDELQRYLDMIDPQYANAVLNPALADIERNREMVQAKNASAAAAASAFGGSRHGLTEAETNRAYADQVAKTTGDLRMNMFDKALGSLQSDLTRRLQADTSNQGMDWNVAGKNADLLQGANIANQSTRAQMNMFNAGEANKAAAAKAAGTLQGMLSTQDLRAKLASDLSRLGLDTANNNNTQRTNRDYNQGQLDSDAARIRLSASDSANAFATSTQTRALELAKALGEVGDKQQKQKQTEMDVEQYNEEYAAWFPIIQAFLKGDLLKYGIGPTTNFQTGSTTEYGNSTVTPSKFDTLTKLLGAIMSDERLKKDISPIDRPLSRLRKLNGVTYTWSANGQPDAGLLAQDVKRAMPGAVIEGMGPMMYEMPKVVGLLTESVKQLDRKVNGKKGGKR